MSFILDGLSQVWQSASSGLQGSTSGDEQKEKRFLSELKAQLDAVTAQIK